MSVLSHAAFPQHKTVQDTFSENSNYKSNDVVTDSILIESVYDVVDNPIQKLIGGPNESEENIFQSMKYECNRLYSFRSKWPIGNIKPESLAKAGLFYLQHEDRVQCPFCFVIIYNWTYGDKPLREHMKKSPKCPFLMGSDVGNVPMFSEHQKTLPKPLPASNTEFSSQSTIASYKPKHPRMADIQRRLLTYSGWQLVVPPPQQLAECGLYYSGVADVVICFFCGGSLGNWESTDNPWEEHTKFFPDCAFLSLARNKNLNSRIIGSCGMQSMKPMSSPVYKPTATSLTSEIVEQALAIFPKSLVLDAVKRNGGNIFSLQQLCDEILQLKQKQISGPSMSVMSGKNLTNHESEALKVSDKFQPNAKFKNICTDNSDTLLCKICMDTERDVVFQPCGHLVSCWKCARLISDCPVCRRHITNVIKTYFS